MSKKVCVIGDAILDRYVYGQVNRMSPEAPVPVMEIGGRFDRAGGACNVALNIEALGGSVTLLSIIGQDDAGRDLVAEVTLQLSSFHLQQERIDTTVKTRYISGGQHLLRIDHEVTAQPKDLDNILRYFRGYMEQYHYVIFSDYGKHFQPITQEIINAAKGAKIPIAIDPKSPDWSIYRGADLITPNRKEFRAASGGETPAAMLKRFDLGAILITDGADGMAYFSPKHKPVTKTTQRIEVADTCGAGDTAVAAFVQSQIEGMSIDVGMAFANAAAGIVCTKIGTQVASRKEIQTPVKMAA
jgi:rfaE bifunctional protein kinase chain/domain